MTLLPSMLGRSAHVKDNATTRRDGTGWGIVTIVGAHAGGLFRDKVYFTVTWKKSPYDVVKVFTYPTAWICLLPTSEEPWTPSTPTT